MKILFLKQIYLTAKSFKKLHSNYYTPDESLSFGKNFSYDRFSIFNLNITSMNKNLEKFKTFYLALRILLK